MANKQVCNINFLFYIRFFCGYYNDFKTSKPIQWLGRCYCCIICTSIIYLFNYTFRGNFYPKSMVIIIDIEYFSHVLISLLISNKYLLQYYQKIPFIDTGTQPYKIMHTCLIVYVIFVILVKLAGLVYIITLYSTRMSFLHFALCEIMTRAVVDIGRLPFLFVFFLFYIRVRVMKQIMASNDFDCRNQGKHHPRRYIQMYQAIMNALEKTEGPVKLQLLVCILFMSTFYFLAIVIDLFYWKNFDVYNVNNIDLMWYFEITVSFSPLFLSAVFLDLVSLEMQNMLNIVLERRIACKNERDRVEIENLFQLLKANPFQYSLCRIIPLNVRSLLSFISFSITTVIAILQIQGWNN